ncbi:arylesterase [Catenovulum sp. 2E275]|uniref:arylesterase n=1 Tax=Catenovulum sp. 2E275 TaxID=2980497 RepID=UPI0021D2C856|nr:arylesterase [Catenovulum sp. 2E275]MCU4676815.1 arylesterase [Catenovulum sp. 2E275]
MTVPFYKYFNLFGFAKLLSVFILLSFNLVHSAYAENNKQTLLILGDSLSAGYGLDVEQSWAHLLAQDWQQNYPERNIINASISGDTTSGGLNRLNKLLDQHQPAWVLIELGGNDGLRGFQLPVIKQNLTQLVQLTEQKGAEAILAEIKIPPNYGQRYVSRFTQQYHEIAQEFKLDLIPFFIESVAVNPDLMQRDGIHPNAQAQPQIKDFMDKALNNAIQSTN